MHIGTLRTVMFDYYLARQTGGQFIVRIEDTDQARLVEGAVESLLNTFKKLNIDYDEGPILLPDGTLSEKGDVGPYTQSKRLDLYRPHADRLLADGNAYVCFCTSERLVEMRAAQVDAKQNPKYDRRCAGLSLDEVKARQEAGEKFVIRLRIPEGESKFVDAIRGEISFNNADVDDQVIIKSDGFASYHLAVVVDDYLMKISHVLRGEEWISSTPKQIILCAMLGIAMPVYAHVPLILNPDKTKLSKRKGDVSVESYLSKGYLPETLINFISTLGYNPKADQEIYDRAELVELFDLSKVSRAGAVMNIEKLDWMNHQYLMKLTQNELVAAVQPFTTLDLASPTLQKALIIERERVSRLTEFADKLGAYVGVAAYDPAILTWKKSTTEDSALQLKNVTAVIGQLDEAAFAEVVLLEAAIKEYITINGLQNGNVLWPMRVALSGLEKSASPYELLWALGKEESLARLQRALELVG